MQLVSLTANKETFKNIYFHNGLNIIYGTEHHGDSKNSNTYNGVGKTMVLHLIHFCLGSDKINDFEKKLPGWQFTLTFVLKHTTHVVVRCTSDQAKINYDGRSMRVPDFRDLMKHEVFIDEDIKHLTWMAMFSRFARRSLDSYTRFDKIHAKEPDYASLLVNCFLLGIDTSLITDKINDREQQNTIKTNLNNLKNDSILSEYFKSETNPNIQINYYESEIARLQKQLSQFKVSENYHEIQLKADELHKKKQVLENKRVLRENNIKSIQESIRQSKESDYTSAYQVYEHASIEIPEMVRVSIDQVNDFHRSLLESRRTRLNKELKDMEAQLRAINAELKEDGEEMDRLLSYLQTHRALDEYASIANRISDLKDKQSKINDFNKLLKSYQSKKLELDKEIAQKNADAQNYLDEHKQLLDDLSSAFTRFAERFYPKKPCGLTLENNTRDNMVRYNLEAHIESDASDGINAVKIFCFDLLLLIQQVSEMRMLCHDSRLYGNMDPRQRTELFRLAYTTCQEYGMQYICSLTKDQLETIHDNMDPQEYQLIFNDAFILELTDESDAAKLLGMQVDIQIN